jgi:hypothetical protein
VDISSNQSIDFARPSRGRELASLFTAFWSIGPKERPGPSKVGFPADAVMVAL